MPRKSSPHQLTKRRILDASVAYADENGTDSLTMRKIADTLGCGVMSLYNHVANKDEMIEGMVDTVAGEMESPCEDREWKDSIRASAIAARETLMRHPWAAAEWPRRTPGPHRIHYMNSILAVLSEAGMRPSLVYRGYHAVTMHIVGFAVQQVGFEQSIGGDFENAANRFLEELSGNYPYLAEHVQAHIDGECTGDEFVFVLDLILDGIQRANDRCLSDDNLSPGASS